MKNFALTDIEWLKKGVIVVQEAENPIQIRKGISTRETMPTFIKEHLPERADRLKELGIDLVVVSGFDSIGYELEEVGIAYQKQLAKALHKNGIKIGAYVETIGAIAYEGVAVEEPSCKEWVQRDYLGRRPTYYNQYNRYIPCINNEEYLKYMEKGLKYAVESLNADLVFFDNYGYYSFSCSCENCRKAFRDYLEDKYKTSEAKIERLGFPRVDAIEPPPFPDSFNLGFKDPFLSLYLYDSGIVSDPVQQEWIDFRCKRLGDVSKRIRNYLKSLSPDIAIVWNVPYMGPMGYVNNALFHGIWPTEVYPHCDAFAAEADQGMLGLRDDGKLLSRIRTFKYARKLKKGVWMTNFNRENIELDLSESMAYNPFVYNTVGTTGLDYIEPGAAKYIDFFKTNRDYFTDTEEISEVALLNSYASLSYQTTGPLRSMIYMEEVLIRSKIPYSVVFDEDLEDISNFSVLILPNVKYLSAKQLRQIKKYVKDGGSIIATDQTSIFDEWGRRYKGVALFTTPIEEQAYGLEDVLGIKWPSKQIVTGKLGKGKFAVIPNIEQHKKDPDYSSVSHSIGPSVTYLKPLQGYLPANWMDILNTIKWARKGREMVEIEAPMSVTVELVKQERNNRIIFNFVNYNLNNSVNDIEVKYNIGLSIKITGLEFLTPENECNINLKYRHEDGCIKFSLPEFKTYGMAVIRYVNMQ